MPSQPKAALRTRAQDKSSKRYQDAMARKACVDAVWMRADSRCEACGRIVFRASLVPDNVGHVHEETFRSRGGDPHDPANCVLLDAQCHQQAHGLRVGAHRRSVRAER